MRSETLLNQDFESANTESDEQKCGSMAACKWLSALLGAVDIQLSFPGDRIGRSSEY